ncbi:MAG TPA: recombination regulator RecX [Treponema sp.]|nr:recombination regulator RecX [Treponema sp.]
MVISAAEQVSPGRIKIATADGPAFFIRTVYLQCVDPELIIPAAEFSGEEEQDVLDAGLCYAAESKASAYLARAEQSRFGLSRKLVSKGMEKQYIDKALDYLENARFLSDSRYASAWLNCRKAAHHEGRIRLAAELASRGIDRHTAEDALNEYFEENPEDGECRKAVEKCMRRGMDYDKTVHCLIQHGFSPGMTAAVMDTFTYQEKKSR